MSYSIEKKTLVGAHMSIAGGLEKAIERGESIGCTAIQIFTKSNRQWHAKEITEKEAERFKKAVSQSSIQQILVHATYLMNLGSPKETTAKRSVRALTDELLRCEQLGIPYLVVHPGSRLDSEIDTCLQQISSNIDSALEKTERKTMILLETMAGQGTIVCYEFEQIASVINQSRYADSIGVCFDTCHTFAAGYDFRDKNSYHALWQKFDTSIGLDKLLAIHMNDSQKGLGTRKDRHEDIGKGLLGLEAFKLIMNDKKFVSIPKIIETPAETLEGYKHEVALLRSLID